MKVTLTITTTIPAKVKLSKEKAIELAGELLPGVDMVRVEGGKYTWLVVFEERGNDYGEWVGYRLGKCRVCGRDVMEGGEWCRGCLPQRLHNGDEGYYGIEQCLRVVGEIANGLSEWEKRMMVKEWGG